VLVAAGHLLPGAQALYQWHVHSSAAYYHIGPIAVFVCGVLGVGYFAYLLSGGDEHVDVFFSVVTSLALFLSAALFCKEASRGYDRHTRTIRIKRYTRSSWC
jgi:hypothetical protein